MLAVETPKFVWYLMRGSGLVALVLLSITVALGVLGVRRAASSRWPRVLTAGLHRNASLLALCFLGLHVLTATLDSWVGLGWLGIVVPFRSHYSPLGVGLGVLAGDLLLAVLATSLLRRHLSYRAWRSVHWMAWLMWPLAIGHAIGAGTDATAPWAIGIEAASAALVLAAAGWRLGAARRTARPAPAAVTRLAGARLAALSGAGVPGPSTGSGEPVRTPPTTASPPHSSVLVGSSPGPSLGGPS